MIPLIENNIDALRQTCVLHHVKALYLVGSAARDEHKSNSDIDFLYQFKENEIGDEQYADNFFSFKDKLSFLLHNNIDLIAYDYLKNPYFIRSIEKDKKLIYEG